MWILDIYCFLVRRSEKALLQKLWYKLEWHVDYEGLRKLVVVAPSFRALLRDWGLLPQDQPIGSRPFSVSSSVAND